MDAVISTLTVTFLINLSVVIALGPTPIYLRCTCMFCDSLLFKVRSRSVVFMYCSEYCFATCTCHSIDYTCMYNYMAYILHGHVTDYMLDVITC